jgi:selenocysteine lyase/cysteine desulfurase
MSTASISTMPARRCLRVSPHYYNSHGEIDTTVGALEEILAGR